MNLKRYLLPVAAMMAMSAASVAQQPYGGCWHPDDIKDWSPETDPDAKFNRARVPLAERFREPELMKATATQWYEGQITNATILFNTCSACPSQGANNFVGYQPTYWQYMDKLVYWAGSASEGIIIPPPAPSIDAAHQAGVKALGQIFFPPYAFGGEGKWVSQMLTKENGEFIYARKLYEIAKYLGFDGWFINEETWGGSSKEWPDFIKEFNRIADENGDTWFEIQWYDSSRRPYTKILKTHKNTSHFLEYGSVGDHRNFASSLGCTVEETFSKIYGGIECAQSGLTGYGYALTSAFKDDGHVGSVALFCPEEHSWKDKVKDLLGSEDTGAKAYEAVTGVFDNEELAWVNSAGDPSVKTSSSGQSSWRGISSHILERSTISSMPFVSNMCVGVGKHRFVDGVKQGTQDWYHSGVQSILPTWRFWIENRGDIKVTIDWDKAYNHGSSFKFAGTLSGEALVRLYKTMIPVTNGGVVRVVFKGGAAPELKLSTTSSVNPDVTLQAKTSEKNGWTVADYDLASLNGKTIYMIGLNLKGSGKLNMNLGQLAVLPAGYAPESVDVKNLKLEANLGEEKGDMRITWDFDWSDDFEHFDIYTQDMSGNRTLVGQTRDEAFYLPRITRNGVDAKVDIQIVPVMKDMVQRAPVTESADYPNATAPVVSFRLSKSYLKVGETATIEAIGSGAPTAWAWTLPEGLELVSGALTDNVITVKGVKEGRHVISVAATNAIGTTNTEAELVDVYTEETYSDVHNVVLNKTVVSFSQSANSSEVPSKIIDGVRKPGSTGEKWCATTPNNWAIFDLESVYRIYGFGIWDCKAGPENAENFAAYTIELSLDGENWTTVVNEEGRGSDDIKYDNIAPTSGRYVRLSPKNTGVLRIWEFEVYGADESGIEASVDVADLNLMSGDKGNIIVTYDLKGFERADDFRCEAVMGKGIVEVGEIAENSTDHTFTIPYTALDVMGETDMVITVYNGGLYAENQVHVIVDSDSYPNIVTGLTAVMRHYEDNYSPTAKYKEYTTTKLTDGDVEEDVCSEIELFSTHADDFRIIFEADRKWIVSKVNVHFPNANKGKNDNDLDGFVNKGITIAVGNDLNNLTIVRKYTDLTEVSKLSCIFPETVTCKYVVVICDINAYFYPAMAEIEVFGTGDNKDMVYEPVEITNWMHDVVAEAKASATHTDAVLDDQGWVLYSADIQAKGALCGADRTLVSNDGTKFVIAPFDSHNALVLKDNLSGTLELAEPSNCSELQILLISANGESKLNVKVNYTDGTSSEARTYSIADWFGAEPDAAKTGLGRIVTQRADNYRADDIDSRYKFQLFEKIIETDITKKVKSLSFESTNRGKYPTVLAVSRTGLKGEQSGIDSILDTENGVDVEAIYNLQGMQVKNPSSGIYIVRYSDGTVKKVVLK